MTPLLAGAAFFLFGSRSVFLASAGLSVVAWGLSTQLTPPLK
ncbi:MAG: hypothetical protein ACHQ5A_13795 [Opitutales bacterium]